MAQEAEKPGEAEKPEEGEKAEEAPEAPEEAPICICVQSGAHRLSPHLRLSGYASYP